MSVVIDRHRVLAALLILLVGCPPPTTNTPSSAPAVAPVSSQAYFIRLASLTIGGDFDGQGDEEVQVIVKANGESRRLFGSRTLQLPDEALRTFDFADGRLVEIPAFPRLSLDLEAFDVDVTGSEVICGGTVEVGLDAYGEEGAPGRATVDLGTIRGISQTALVVQKSFTIPGATCALALVRAPRRDAPDEASRALTAELFGPALAARAPSTSAEADALRSALRPALDAAQTRAEASTHTHVRASIPRLVDAAEPLLRALDDAAGPSAKELQESLALLREALAKVTPQERAGREALFADVQAIVDAGPPAAEAGPLQAAASKVAAAKAALEAPAASEAASEQHLEGLLAGYGARLEGAQRALTALPEVAPRLAALQTAIRSAAN